MASLSNPVNIKKLLDNQQQQNDLKMSADLQAVNDQVAVDIRDARGIITGDNSWTRSTIKTVVNAQTDEIDAALSAIRTGAPINAIMPLQVGGVPMYTAVNGTVWLKSGYVETDVASYPDATISSSAIENTARPLNAVGGSAKSVDWNGVNFVSLGWNPSIIHVLDNDFIATGVTYNVSNQTYARGFSYDKYLDIYWVIKNSNSGLQKTTLTGSNLGAYSTPSTYYDVEPVVDGIYLLYITGEFVKFSTDVVATGESHNIFEYIASPKAVARDATHWWFYDDDTRIVYQFDDAFIPTGSSFKIPSSIDIVTAMFWANGVFYVKNSASKVVAMDSVPSFVGVAARSVDSVTGIPIYARVK